ncbi:SAM-dependent methyltransferase [Herbaspirillum sp. Sphag1AN]|uniref:methyltransferase n=1 Tax=unclassified Herbaspirillum TaxID=2624150 RepID=UPI00161F4100|nr:MULTISPECIES: class I SAM-dependent methyltransferase [unclassified Herbaspirillum]MBB3212372.1 SAM-dependent methyltransferase [Herbaspirillum sp. Sphag1AN]MBB3245529.1 SAM-dependent methyltransferase [Herbaspirillum sp. Sphag64]
MSEHPTISWNEAGEQRSARWRSEVGNPAPKRVVIADDTLAADAAYKLACEGTALLWRGDYQNARQLLQALARRIDRKTTRSSVKKTAAKPASNSSVAAPDMTQSFHLHRQAQAQRARILGMLLLPLAPDYRLNLRRAPDISQACTEAYGPTDAIDSVVSLREVLGLIGAHEWRKKGVPVAALGATIHPYYGVFSPVRGEYLDLVAQAPLPPKATELAFDIGTGTGVLAALLVQRGVRKVIATDLNPRALECAADNLQRLGVADRVELTQSDLFPPDKASLIICNPPWVPAKPGSAIEAAVYDPDSRMLKGFLAGLPDHLSEQGEGWLILSDFAEHLGLRSRAVLLDLFEQAGLRVIERHDIKPRHPRASDAEDPLYTARSKEVTSLWRLALK